MECLQNSDGLVNLRMMADQLAARGLHEDKSIPIVLVPGFSGWGTPLFGTLNYWGGVECLPKVLMDQGYTVIVSPIAPLSTNWERACELYRMLTFGKFSNFDVETNEINEADGFDVDVNYGRYFDSSPETGPETSYGTGRRRAILFSQTPETYENWTWSEEHKVHFICHSQGGNTARYLISLMDRGAKNTHPEYFGVGGRDNWIISMTTLGTPHRGTTVINVLENLVPAFKDQVVLLSRSFATIAFQNPKQRAYDLQLDHWGICRKGQESFQEMRKRFEMDSGPVGKWLNSNHNGFYDNSIEGVDKLNKAADDTSSQVYYFSLSFHATQPFPTKWPDWTLKSIHEFPLPLVNSIRKLLSRIPFLDRGSAAINRFLGPILEKLERKLLSSIVGIKALIGWSTFSVAKNFLKTMDIEAELPPPGDFMPRKDVIPFMMPTCYAMSGLDLTAAQCGILGKNLGDWHQNDGIVNTESMRGPCEKVVRHISEFPLEHIDSIDARGLYWHMGTNDTMDHADEIGVFIDDDTSHATKNMYLNLARLVSRLPNSQLANSTINGKVNGHVKEHVNEHVNGHVNGKTKVQVNGHINSDAGREANDHLKRLSTL